MACGQVSGGIIAINLDCHSDEANGLHFLRDWEVKHGKLQETWTQITGSGGKQLFYRAGQDIRNSANGEIGVDVRGNGGCGVLPPSLHPCGDCYEWSISPDDMDVRPTPMTRCTTSMKLCPRRKTRQAGTPRRRASRQRSRRTETRRFSRSGARSSRAAAAMTRWRRSFARSTRRFAAPAPSRRGGEARRLHQQQGAGQRRARREERRHHRSRHRGTRIAARATTARAAD